jgi:hypothetical protein
MTKPDNRFVSRQLSCGLMKLQKLWFANQAIFSMLRPPSTWEHEPCSLLNLGLVIKINPLEIEDTRTF